MEVEPGGASVWEPQIQQSGLEFPLLCELQLVQDLSVPALGGGN